MSSKATLLEVEGAGFEQPRGRRRQLTLGKVVGAACTLVAAGAFYFSLPHLSHTCSRWASRKPGVQTGLSVEERARQVLLDTPLIDGHEDFAIWLRFHYKNRIDNDEFRHAFESGELSSHLDLARARQGLSGGAFWSVFIPCPVNGSDFSDENYYQSVQATLQQIDVMNRLFAAYPDDFAPSLSSADALDAFAQGKLISPFGVEGLHQIGNSAANLRLFHELGVRYVTLTHNCHNKYADAAIQGWPPRKATPLWGGVSPLGRRMVHEMNRIGVIVDLSHVSDDTMIQVLGGQSDWAGSEAPIIFSHSSAYSICPHPRNVKDAVLRLVKARNSLVMVNISPGFIACADRGNSNGLPEDVPEEATLGRVAEHIIYIGNLIGFEHVGVGTDFDGIDSVPKGMEDVSKYPDLVAELLRRGVSDDDAGKVVGGNLLRVWREVENVSAQMKARGAPIFEDELQALEIKSSRGMIDKS